LEAIQKNFKLKKSACKSRR